MQHRIDLPANVGHGPIGGFAQILLRFLPSAGGAKLAGETAWPEWPTVVTSSFSARASPYPAAGGNTPLSLGTASVSGVLATGLSALATWYGLGWADRANLPMPLLRAFETGAVTPNAGRLAALALLSGVFVGGFGLAVLRLAQVPNAPGSFLIRVASALFAAVTLESVLHLAIMSGVVAATGRVGLGIAASTLAGWVRSNSGRPAATTSMPRTPPASRIERTSWPCLPVTTMRTGNVDIRKGYRGPRTQWFRLAR